MLLGILVWWLIDNLENKIVIMDVRVMKLS